MHISIMEGTCAGRAHSSGHTHLCIWTYRKQMLLPLFRERVAKG